MTYGIRWYRGVGEHDYEESGFEEHDSVSELMDSLVLSGAATVGIDALFDALVDGRQDSIYWLTDNFGFELYRPTQPSPHEPETE